MCGVAKPTMVFNCFQLVFVLATVGLMRYFAQGPKHFMLTTLAMVFLVLCAGLDFPVWSLDDSVAHAFVLALGEWLTVAALVNQVVLVLGQWLTVAMVCSFRAWHAGLVFAW